MKKVLRRIDNQRKSEINQLENFSEPFLMKILVQQNEPIVGFWCQIIVQKFLQRFEPSFKIEMMVEIYMPLNLFFNPATLFRVTS